MAQPGFSFYFTVWNELSSRKYTNISYSTRIVFDRPDFLADCTSLVTSVLFTSYELVLSAKSTWNLLTFVPIEACEVMCATKKAFLVENILDIFRIYCQHALAKYLKYYKYALPSGDFHNWFIIYYVICCGSGQKCSNLCQSETILLNELSSTLVVLQAIDPRARKVSYDVLGSLGTCTWDNIDRMPFGQFLWSNVIYWKGTRNVSVVLYLCRRFPDVN